MAMLLAVSRQYRNTDGCTVLGGRGGVVGRLYVHILTLGESRARSKREHSRASERGFLRLRCRACCLRTRCCVGGRSRSRWHSRGRFGRGRFFASSSWSGTSIAFIDVASLILITALRCGSIASLSCPLSDLPPLSVTETQIFTVEEVEKILYCLLVACLPSLGLLKHRIFIEVGDGQSSCFEGLKELFGWLRARCRARKGGIQRSHRVHDGYTWRGRSK